ncbi:MAG: GntR family transcriptional regulator [Candidatus Eremiobacteraeota bacterium]|nr:GntR family transcriptional regulator [Candidatus Eremiobacteraeota bacterium]
MGVRATPASTRSDEVYQRLRDEIVKGAIQPNERLVEVDLAERLGVSRTPIRESLKRLAADGLIHGGRHHLVVREHAPDEIREIYESRAALEGYAARLASERASPSEFAEIARWHEPEVRNLVRSPRQHIVDVNDRFHDAIIAAAHNRRLLDLIRRNREFYFNYRIASLYTDAEAQASLEGHSAILQALRDRNPDAAEAATRAHVFEALGVTLAKLQAIL